MKTSKILTRKQLEKLQKQPIDFSDIPEQTEEQLKEFYPRNWKPRKAAISARIDMDTLEWLKEPGEKGYLQRLNAVLRWARLAGCPINEL